MNNTIHVCYSLNDINGNYAKFIGASLCSLFDNTSAHVAAHILHDDTLTDENRIRLVNMTKYYGQDIYFYNVFTYPAMIDFIAQMNRIFISRYQGMFYRLGIGIILPPNLERVIYLDADIIVNMDIAKLWSLPLGDTSIAAVSDSVISLLPFELSPLLVKNRIVEQDKYFNSGMLIMNMNYFREHPQIISNMVEFLLEHDNWREYPDQDFLNYYFNQSCLHLPIEFNFLVNYARLKNISKEEAIFHYAGGALTLDTSDPFNALFWYYLHKTPWQNELTVMQSLSELGKNCRELAEKTAVLKLLLVKPKHLFFGSSTLFSKLSPSFEGIFYDSGEDETNNLDLGNILDVLNSIPINERIMVVVSHHYDILKKFFDNMGLKEGSDFVNGYVLTLPEQPITYFNDSSIIRRY